MKNLLKVSFLTACLVVSSAALADQPCKDKRDAKKTARKALGTCLEAWGKSGKPGEADPSDDCNGKLTEFINSTKALKACRVEHKK